MTKNYSWNEEKLEVFKLMFLRHISVLDELEQFVVDETIKEYAVWVLQRLTECLND